MFWTAEMVERYDSIKDDGIILKVRYSVGNCLKLQRSPVDIFIDFFFVENFCLPQISRRS